jgi:phosphoglycerate dehydrogenase-like enzyme
MTTVHRVKVTPTMLSGMQDAFAPLENRGIEVVHNTGTYPMDVAELTQWISDAEAVIAGLDELSRDVFIACPQLKIVARNGVGLDNVNLPAATEYGVLVTVPLGANSTSVAELTIGLLISLVRGVVNNHNRIQQGTWERFPGIELAGKTLGIIGLGRIGKKVARRATAFGIQVIAHDIAPDHDFAREHRIAFVPRDDLLAASDFVSLHVPLDTSTQNMIDTSAFSQMRPGTFLVNTARGGVVDHSALVEALNSGHIAGAALDVHPVEGVVDTILLARPNVITTTHLGAYTHASLRYTAQAAVQNIIDLLDGKLTENVVNPEVWSCD